MRFHINYQDGEGAKRISEIASQSIELESNAEALETKHTLT